MDLINTAIPIIDEAFYSILYGKILCCKSYDSEFTDCLVVSERVTNNLSSQTAGCSTVKLRTAAFWLAFLITEGRYNKINVLILKIRLPKIQQFMYHVHLIGHCDVL